MQHDGDRLQGYGDHNRRELIAEAVSEIKKAGLKDYAMGGEEAALFLEKVSQAIEQVDSSSDAIGIIESGLTERM